MTLSQISTPLTRDQAYALVDAVMELGDLALTASAHEDTTTGEWVFEATCEMLPDLLAFEELARGTLGGDVDFTITPIDCRKIEPPERASLRSIVASGSAKAPELHVCTKFGPAPEVEGVPSKSSSQ